MEDQVKGLRKRGISALAINSGMSKTEIDVALDNAVYGDIKFLYLSPERLLTDIVKARVAKMKICLLAIDEAHCISEWGHDFRPAYRRIAEFKELLPKVPAIALTATATPPVVADIGDMLDMAEPDIFQKSFTRSNLTYVVQEEENKLQRLLRLIQYSKGSGILYVQTRRDTITKAKELRASGVSAVAYHGGMAYKDRIEAQDLWIRGRAQVMVATNAFGMGIDKPDVRFVAHIGIPLSIEAYFQEAGRAGRDGKKAYGVLFTSAADLSDLDRKGAELVPDNETITQTFRALTNHFQLAMGSSMDQPKPFDIAAFSSKYGLNAGRVYKSLKVLEKEEIIYLSESFFSPSKLQVLANSKDLYSFEVAHPKYEKLIHFLLRSYDGVFDQLVRINENNIGAKINASASAVKEQLRALEQFRLIRYQESSDLPFISFPQDRPGVSDLKLDQGHLKEYRKQQEAKVKAIRDYVENDVVCRSVQLVEYFGEKNALPCGKCDVCIAYRGKEKNKEGLNRINNLILEEVGNYGIFLHELRILKTEPANDVLYTVRWLIDDGVLTMDDLQFIKVRDGQ